MVGILIGIIIRDIVLTIVRSYKELKGQEFRTSFISKTKTFLQMTYIFIIIFAVTAGMTFEGTEFGGNVFAFLYSDLNYYLLLLITTLTVLSGAVYIFESRAGTESKPV
jgi:phosphatidylglycerophosphate synthase